MNLSNKLSKVWMFFFIFCLVWLQAKLWLGDGGFQEVERLRKLVIEQQKELESLEIRNQKIILEIQNLKQFPEAIEEKARYELGMIKNGESYFQVVEPIE